MDGSDFEGEEPRRASERVRESREDAYRGELEKERRRRQQLERQVREVLEENRRRVIESEEARRNTEIRESLRDLGVKKTDLAMRLVREDIRRGDEGELYGEHAGERLPLQSYLKRFVSENPEFLPPRIPGGSGAQGREFGGISSSGMELETIRPGMSAEETRRAWKEVARLMGRGDDQT